jgi:hypothetical protein
LRLNRYFRYFLYCIFSVLFLSGSGWYIADGLKDSPDGDIWQAVSANLLMMHGGAAMITLIALGTLIPLHVIRGWRADRNLVTGVTMATLNAALIVTAFGLYYLGSERLRLFVSNIHLAAGLAFPLLLFAHIFLGRRQRRALPPPYAPKSFRIGE